MKMEELICLFNKWYNKKVFEYKTWCSNKTEQKQLRDNGKTHKETIMTRKEEIINAAREYNNGITFSNPSNVLHFEAGAHWVDKHPDLSSLWHDPSEEPKEDMDILFISKNGKVHKVSKIDHQLYDWLKDNDGIDKWVYISELLPKGE